MAHTQEVQAALKGLEITLLEAQGGRRGYALTGAESYLAPYREAAASVDGRLKALAELTLDNPRQQERVRSLAPVVARRLGAMRDAVELQRTKGRDSATMAALTLLGDESMEAVREILDQMAEEEGGLLIQRQAAARSAATRTVFVISVGTLAALALVGAATLLARAERRQRDAVEAERRRLEDERNLLFELSDDLIYIGAADRSFQRLNPAWERGLGHSRDVLLARPVMELVHPEDREATEAAMESIRRSGATAALENRLRCADGSYRWLQWSVQVPPEQGLTFAIGRDVTGQREALEEMRQAREATEVANRELEAFSYSVSHDLRAPLRHIDGFVDLLRKTTADRLDETGHRYLDVISEAARRMGALIDDLLAFSRMGRTDMHRARVDLGRVLDEVLAEVQADAEGREIEWKVDRLPVVDGDAAMLRLVLQNLVSNAVKYTRQRAPAHIEIGASDRDAEHVLFVRDDGAGFDMKYADKLFGVFQRLHHAEEFEGTGIGLATVRRIVDRHAGRTWAEATPDRGATFYVSLPSDGRGAA